MAEAFKWFRGHLNWTAILVTIGAGLTGYLIIRLILLVTGLSQIPFPVRSYSSYGFSFQVGVDIANIISIPCFGWILKQKNRSLWFLSFFLPPFIPAPLAFFTIIVLLPFWLVGLIILLLLKKKSRESTNKNLGFNEI